MLGAEHKSVLADLKHNTQKPFFAPLDVEIPKSSNPKKTRKKALGGGMKSPPCTLLEGEGISKVTSGDGLKRKKKGFLPTFFSWRGKVFPSFFL